MGGGIYPSMVTGGTLKVLTCIYGLKETLPVFSVVIRCKSLSITHEGVCGWWH